MPEELKCPICGKPLVRTLVNNPYGAPGRMDALKCNDCDCSLFGTVGLWEELFDVTERLSYCEGALEEHREWFNKSQKKLGIAIEAIKKIMNRNLERPDLVAKKALLDINLYDLVGSDFFDKQQQ